MDWSKNIWHLWIGRCFLKFSVQHKDSLRKKALKCISSMPKISATVLLLMIEWEHLEFRYWIQDIRAPLFILIWVGSRTRERIWMVHSESCHPQWAGKNMKLGKTKLGMSYWGTNTSNHDWDAFTLQILSDSKSD